MKYAYYFALIMLSVGLITYFTWPRYTLLIVGVFMIISELLESESGKKVKLEIDIKMDGVGKYRVFNGR